MRKLSVLYGTLLSSLTSDRVGHDNGGICGEINFLIKRDYKISKAEVEKLRRHFDKQKNVAEKLYKYHPLWKGRSYWWQEMEKFNIVHYQSAVEVRVGFINYILTKLK